MKDTFKNILIAVLCTVILLSVTLSIRAIRAAQSQEPVNPNVTLVTVPDQQDFEEHPDWTIPVTEPVYYGENLALGKEVQQNGQTQTYNCRNINDGDRFTYWEGKADTYPNIVTFDLAAQCEITGVRILLNPRQLWSARDQEVELQISDDGESFTTIFEKTTLSFDPLEDNSVYLPFDAAVSGQYIRFLFHSNTGAGAGQAAEIEIFGQQQ